MQLYCIAVNDTALHYNTCIRANTHGKIMFLARMVPVICGYVSVSNLLVQILVWGLLCISIFAPCDLYLKNVVAFAVCRVDCPLCFGFVWGASMVTCVFVVVLFFFLVGQAVMTAAIVAVFLGYGTPWFEGTLLALFFPKGNRHFIGFRYSETAPFAYVF